MAYGDICGGYPVRTTIASHSMASVRSASSRPPWSSSVKYSPPTVQSTIPAPKAAPTGRVHTIVERSIPSSAPATTANSATGTRKSVWSSQRAPCTDQVTARAMTASRPRLSQPARG